MKLWVSLKFACVKVYIWRVLNGRKNRCDTVKWITYLTERSFDQRLSEVNPDFQAARFDSKHTFLLWSAFQVLDTINRLLHLVNSSFSFSYTPYWYNVYTLLSDECSSLCIECLRMIYLKEINSKIIFLKSISYSWLYTDSGVQ